MSFAVSFSQSFSPYFLSIYLYLHFSWLYCSFSLFHIILCCHCNSGCFNICECECELYSIACSFLLYSIFLFSMFRSDFFPPFFARFGSCSDCNWMCEIFFQHSTFTMSHIHSLPVQTKDLRLYVSFFSFSPLCSERFDACFFFLVLLLLLLVKEILIIYWCNNFGIRQWDKIKYNIYYMDGWSDVSSFYSNSDTIQTV